MSDEFTIDIDKALKNAKDNDLAGSFIDRYPDGLESVRKSVDNCVAMAGLDKKVMEDLLKGEWSVYETLNSVGRSSKIIKIEYDIQQRDQGSS
jgi:hypothetical protein|tara:strand:+ start:421 stop:699 length:279 start_codon:yes stop_codon:yes gene_type:complete